MKKLLEQLGFKELPILSEFLLKQRGHFPKGTPPIEVYEIRDERNMQYYNLITQPLTKGMFIPCSEDGNVMIEPECECDDGQEEYDCVKENCSQTYYAEQYQQAKDRVLFECDKPEIIYNRIVIDGIMLKNTLGGFTADGKDIETIEQAINSGVKLILK
jgi:hypothetical protein